MTIIYLYTLLVPEYSLNKYTPSIHDTQPLTNENTLAAPVDHIQTSILNHNETPLRISQTKP